MVNFCCTIILLALFNSPFNFWISSECSVSLLASLFPSFESLEVESLFFAFWISSHNALKSKSLQSSKKLSIKTISETFFFLYFDKIWFIKSISFFLVELQKVF